jgi:hypothetical protein
MPAENPGADQVIQVPTERPRVEVGQETVQLGEAPPTVEQGQHPLAEGAGGAALDPDGEDVRAEDHRAVVEPYGVGPRSQSVERAAELLPSRPRVRARGGRRRGWPC